MILWAVATKCFRRWEAIFFDPEKRITTDKYEVYDLWMWINNEASIKSNHLWSTIGFVSLGLAFFFFLGSMIVFPMARYDAYSLFYRDNSMWYGFSGFTALVLSCVLFTVAIISFIVSTSWCSQPFWMKNYDGEEIQKEIERRKEKITDQAIESTEGQWKKITKLLRQFETDNIDNNTWGDLPFSYLQCEFLRLTGDLILLPPPHSLFLNSNFDNNTSLSTTVSNRTNINQKPHY